MPHQCVHCGEIYPDASKELLEGCSCGSKFFYYIKQERLDELNRINNSEIQDTLTELARADKIQIEQDIREITGMKEEPEKPVILDIESIRVLSPGKFEIDLVNLFSKKRPIIYKLGEGKYIIDLSSTIKSNKEEIDKKIKDPRLVFPKEERKEKKTEEKKGEKKFGGEKKEEIKEEKPCKVEEEKKEEKSQK